MRRPRTGLVAIHPETDRGFGDSIRSLIAGYHDRGGACANPLGLQRVSDRPELDVVEEGEVGVVTYGRFCSRSQSRAAWWARVMRPQPAGRIMPARSNRWR